MHNTETRESRRLGLSYTITHHESGLDIYVFPKKVSTSHAAIVTRYGAVDNAFRLSPHEDFTVVPDGIAHYLEHKMFEAEDGHDAFERYAETGADANAYTSSTHTAYYFSTTEQFGRSLEILLDMVTHPYFTPQTVEKEQGIIAQEIRMGEDNPSRALYYGTIRALYQKSNLRLNVAGTVESIAEITADLLYRCYDVFYNLRNMALFVCGDVTLDEVLAVADRCLAPAPPITIERRVPEEPSAVASRRFYREMHLAKPLFRIAVKDTDISPDPRERMKKQCAMDVVNCLLFSQSSPLRAALYEDGLISPNLSYGFSHCRDFSYEGIGGESADPEAVFARVFSYVEQMQRRGVAEEDFERCRRVVFADSVGSWDDADEIPFDLMDFVLDGQEIFEEPEVIASLTRADVEHVLRTVFAREMAVMGVVAPLGAAEKQQKEKNP